jgi:hypothetical protein
VNGELALHFAAVVVALAVFFLARAVLRPVFDPRPGMERGRWRGDPHVWALTAVGGFAWLRVVDEPRPSCGWMQFSREFGLLLHRDGTACYLHPDEAKERAQSDNPGPAESLVVVEGDDRGTMRMLQTGHCPCPACRRLRGEG